MKKRELNLTDEEKVNFLTNLKLKNSEVFLNNVKTANKYLKVIAPILVVGFATIMHILFLNIVTTLAAASIPTLLFGGLYYIFNSSLKAEIFTISGGKISYKQYKQLVKSGELAKWQEQFKEELKYVRPLELTNLTNDICRQTRNTTYIKETECNETKNNNTQPISKHTDELQK